LEVITNRLLRPFRSSLLSQAGMVAAAMSLVEAAAVFFLAKQNGLWPLAVGVVLVIELGARIWTPGERKLMERVPEVLMGVSVALVIAVAPRLVTQAVVAVAYGVWRWWSAQRSDGQTGLFSLMLVQAAMFEAIFLMAAMPGWRLPEWLVMVLVWLAAYLSVYSVLARRGERAAGVMAATWALIAVEVSWVLLRWLFVYTVTGGYLLVPQPALILTALAYCFGSIYVSQRQGNLSRGRLTEYLLIGLILIAIVITGTPWRGTL
jgi:hypothetical protein